MFIVLGEMLTKRPATTKIERFFIQQVKLKLKEMSIDRQIEESFISLNKKM